jgi:hypothetical protein
VLLLLVVVLVLHLEEVATSKQSSNIPAQACAYVHQRAALAQSAVVPHALQHLVHACCCNRAIDALYTLATT